MGTLIQISVSPGGVPKLPIGRAIITGDGVVGDAQRNQRFHGGPDRALCIWSEEVIEQLAREGHQIAAGLAGENLTVRGVDWTQVEPDRILHVGPVIAEITSFARPCKTNAQWFVDGSFKRINQSVHPGWSRVYARVLVPGTVTTGATVRLF